MPTIWCCSASMERLLLLGLEPMPRCGCDVGCRFAVLMMILLASMLLLQLASMHRSDSGWTLTV